MCRHTYIIFHTHASLPLDDDDDDDDVTFVMDTALLLDALWCFNVRTFLEMILPMRAVQTPQNS